MWLERDRAHDIYSKINSDFVNNSLYLYPVILLILLSGIICVGLSGKFYYPYVPSNVDAVICSSGNCFLVALIDFNRHMTGRVEGGKTYVAKASKEN